MFKCRHATTTWPRSGADGIDYCTCLECGAVLVSPIQFAQVPGKARLNTDRPITGFNWYPILEAIGWVFALMFFAIAGWIMGGEI